MPYSEAGSPLRDIILNRRRQLGLSRMEIAGAVGFGTCEAIRMIELGLRKFPLDRIHRLAPILNLDGGQLARQALEEQMPNLAALIWTGIE